VTVPHERVLMFVGAHPDDESFGPGGTLAAYAAAGVKVFYTCATRGEAGTVDAKYLGASGTIAATRWTELECAARQLGLAAVIPLEYGDSGMGGAVDGLHPRALARAPLDDVVRDVEGAILALRPQVLITFDPIGGYRHPDHVAIHRATERAFRGARLGAYSPQRLYYWLPRRDRLRVVVRMLRMLGRDPARAGRNRDVDLADVASVQFPVHARIRLSRTAIARRQAALACHRSQLAGPSALRRLMWLLARTINTDELFMRGYPAPGPTEPTETDLFEAVR